MRFAVYFVALGAILLTGCVASLPKPHASSKIVNMVPSPDGGYYIVGNTTATTYRSGGGGAVTPVRSSTQWVLRCVEDVKPDRPGGVLKCDDAVMQGMKLQAKEAEALERLQTGSRRRSEF